MPSVEDLEERFANPSFPHLQRRATTERNPMTETQPYEFPDDLAHPIPRVHAYDTVLTFEGGGAYLGIVIAAPLDASLRSLARLREKLNFYLNSFQSDFGRKEWGTPKPGKMRIYIDMHPLSSEKAFQIIDAWHPEALARGVEFVINRRPPSRA